MFLAVEQIESLKLQNERVTYVNSKMLSILRELKYKHMRSLNSGQKIFAEQRILALILKILQLIDEKTVPHAYRMLRDKGFDVKDKSFGEMRNLQESGLKRIDPQIKNKYVAEENTPQIIAQKYLTPVAKDFYKVRLSQK